MPTSYWLFGTRLKIIAGGEETGGRYDLIEGDFAPGVQTPPHRHAAYSEQLYVLEGEFTVWLAGGKTVLGPGESLTIPAGVTHVVAATGGPSRGLVVASPSGFARLIAEVGTEDESPSDMARFLRASAAIGDEVVGPPGTLPG